MSISSDFALEIALCAALSITLWAACAGVGLQLLPRATGRDVVDSRRRPGVAAGVGLGALMMIGGLALVVRIPWWLYTGPFVLIGLVLAVREFLGFEPIRAIPRSSLVLATLTAAALGFAAVVESLLGLRFLLNRCDDLRAYLPMARRLLETYGLEEPWSVRRAQSMGGFDLLRALPVAVFGNGAGVGVADTAIAGTFLAGLFVGNGLRSIGTRVLCIVLILGVPFAWVPRVNTTGVLLGTPLLVAVLAATAEMRRALRAGDTRGAFRWAAAAGLVIAALMSVRPNLGLLGALVVTLGVLLTTRSRVASRVLVVVAGGASTLVAVASWSFAMWRTVGTPLYPLLSGNMNTPALRGPPVGDLSRRADLAFDLVRSGPYLWIIVAVLVVSVLARRLLADPGFIVIAAVATIIVTTLFALSTPLLRPVLFARYAGPMSQGLAIFLLLELIRAVDVDFADARSRPRLWGVPILAAGVAAAAVSFSTLGFAWRLLPFGQPLVRLAAADGLGGSTHPPDNEALRASYREALASVVGQRTIAAVDRPYLLDYSRFDIPHLDAPGFMTPDGTFPFFTGPGPKIAVLRDAGFDVLLATNPDDDVCLNPARVGPPAQGQGPSAGIYRRFLDWDRDIQAIEDLVPTAVQRFGTLVRIDLRLAQAGLEG